MTLLQMNRGLLWIAETFRTPHLFCEISKKKVMCSNGAPMQVQLLKRDDAIRRALGKAFFI
jgi:hypothetical protein